MVCHSEAKRKSASSQGKHSILTELCTEHGSSARCSSILVVTIVPSCRCFDVRLVRFQVQVGRRGGTWRNFRQQELPSYLPVVTRVRVSWIIMWLTKYTVYLDGTSLLARSQFSALLDRTRKCPAYMPRPHYCKAIACLLKLRAHCIVADHGNCSLVGVGVTRSLEQQPKLRNLHIPDCCKPDREEEVVRDILCFTSLRASQETLWINKYRHSLKT